MTHTTHYKLPLFESNDQPKWLVDWNSAMEKIDLAIHTAQTGDPDTPSLDELYGMIQVIQNELDKIIAQIASNFDEDTDYAVNDFVFNNGELFVCTNAYTAGTGWSLSYFEKIDLASKLTLALNSLVSLDTRVTALENASGGDELKPGSYTRDDFSKYIDYVGDIDNVAIDVAFDVYLDGKDVKVKVFPGCHVENGSVVASTGTYSDLPSFIGKGSGGLTVGGQPLASVVGLDDILYISNGSWDALKTEMYMTLGSVSYLPNFFIGGFGYDYFGGDYETPFRIPFIQNSQTYPVQYGNKSVGNYQYFRPRLLKQGSSLNHGSYAKPAQASISLSRDYQTQKLTSNQLVKLNDMVGIGVYADTNGLNWGFTFTPFADWSPNGISYVEDYQFTQHTPDANGHVIFSLSLSSVTFTLYKIKSEYKNLF